LAPEGVHVRVDDALGQGGGDRRIEGVPAGTEDAEPRFRREVVLAHHRTARAEQSRSLRHRAPLSPPAPARPAGGNHEGTTGARRLSPDRPCFSPAEYRISAAFFVCKPDTATRKGSRHAAVRPPAAPSRIQEEIRDGSEPPPQPHPGRPR